ncbi:hypothetical protein [Chryseobacterium camelliae]|uniref:hypothetical protein n=1 Tax=Chryseobacterium camelliae TaxID=1265445 RepID=UPI00286531B8|nr:hypothetical protein [Chryseobacterium camelliae]MDR6517202.1 uncharacterized protein involved in type VI secretion and phage assembly [Chryseobacterium camelliae]
MDIEGFRAELETRLRIEKEYLVQELSSMQKYEERLELLSKFNEKYKALIKRLADEDGIDLDAFYHNEHDSGSQSLSNRQVILGKTMSIYDHLSDELYEEITTTE